MTKILDLIRNAVRKVIARSAKWLNTLTHGRLTPNMVTWVSLLAHFLVAAYIATSHNLKAALFLVIFGLFDSLDGELARLQNRASSAGMLLDASTDRMKEIILYSGVAWILANGSHPKTAIWAVIACGASLLVSYVKAKGETAVKNHNLSPNQINRLFSDGLMRYEVRMAILVLGLLTNHLLWAVIVIAVASIMTALARLARISRYLNRAES